MSVQIPQINANFYTSLSWICIFISDHIKVCFLPLPIIHSTARYIHLRWRFIHNIVPNFCRKMATVSKLPVTPACKLIAPIYPPHLSFPLAKVVADWGQKFGLPPTYPHSPFSDPSRIIDIWVVRRKLTTEVGEWKYVRIAAVGAKYPECAHDSVSNFSAQFLHLMGMLKIQMERLAKDQTFTLFFVLGTLPNNEPKKSPCTLDW